MALDPTKLGHSSGFLGVVFGGSSNPHKVTANQVGLDKRPKALTNCPNCGAPLEPICSYCKSNNVALMPKDPVPEYRHERGPLVRKK